jgi:enolase-phosphatase E1
MDQVMIKAIITDIEGTITDINFVHKVLFPYSLQKMHDFVHHNYRSIEETIAQIKLKYLSQDSSLDEVIAQLKYWTETDQKIGELKTIQGKIWKNGYETRAFTGHIYIDAYHKLKQWREEGIELYVYSSGSVQAQQLLFKFSDYGDMTPLFLNYFDTQVGAKKEVHSYQNILKLIHHKPDEVLFLSDIEGELEAARAAHMHCLLLDRKQTIKQSQFHKVQDLTHFDIGVFA